MGVEPEVRHVEHASVSRYESPEAALAALARLIRPAGERERRALERYVAGHLVRTGGDDGRPVWTQEPRISVRWTILAWDLPGRGGG
jgi:hypothetical protein